MIKQLRRRIIFLTTANIFGILTIPAIILFTSKIDISTVNRIILCVYPFLAIQLPVILFSLGLLSKNKSIISNSEVKAVCLDENFFSKLPGSLKRYRLFVNVIAIATFTALISYSIVSYVEINRYRNGYWERVYEDGSEYKGEFKNYLKHGRGTLINKTPQLIFALMEVKLCF